MTDLLDWRNPGRNKKIFLIFTSLIFCLLVLTRYQLLNGFSMLNGDRYDAVTESIERNVTLHAHSKPYVTRD